LLLNMSKNPGGVQPLQRTRLAIMSIDQYRSAESRR
jgi:hypothetical protein